MRGWPWIVGGGALAYAFARRSPGATRATVAAAVSPPLLPGRWVWPVPRWNGRVPIISDGFDSPRPGVPRHGGVDIMFARRGGDAFPPGTPNGSKLHVMPEDMPVLAASDGVIWSAMSTPTGHAVVIDHGTGHDPSHKIATFYAHLDRLLVTPTARGASKQRVRAGQMIGTVGASPRDPEDLKHLHLEIWLGGPASKIDPAALMRTWPVLDDPRKPLAARNGALTYRPVGASGEPYPDWVRALKDAAGVYIIRDLATHEVVYVGSSSGRLYDTLTRHFQQWRRYKGYWRGQYGHGHDPGLTYPRQKVEVAIRRTSPADAFDQEMTLIARLRPRDNMIGQPAPADDEIPF